MSPTSKINIVHQYCKYFCRLRAAQMYCIFFNDRFLISNAAYDELRMVSEGGLPSTHLFKDFKNEMSTHIDIKCSATPGVRAII